MKPKFTVFAWKSINFLFAIAIILTIAISIRTLIFFGIGLDTERVFREDLMALLTILVIIIIVRVLIKPYFDKKLKQ